MRQVKILIGEPIAQEAVAQMQSGGAQVDSLAQLGGGSPEEIIGQYEGLVVGQMLQVDEALLARAEKLAVIGKIGKDTSNIDLAAATRAGVAVVNTSQGVRCRAVADALPAYVQRSEPSLEDAYLYLISREAVQ